MTYKNFQNSLAEGVSAIGHPVLLGSIATIYVNLNFLDRKESISLAIQLFLGLVMPLVIFISLKIRRGEFKDFDVSDQQKRNSLYWFLLLLLLIQIILLFVFNHSFLIKAGALTVFVQILLSFGLNQRFKISLHTSFAFLISTMAYTVSHKFAFILFMFAIFIGYSRVYLSRHTSKEVFLGMILGILCGFIFNLVYISCGTL
jgi:membrane-associated phospholipid phosphatase